jgi:hypothetical protein
LLSLIEFTAGHGDEDFIAEAKPHDESSEVETSLCRAKTFLLWILKTFAFSFVETLPVRGMTTGMFFHFVFVCFFERLAVPVYFEPVVRWRVLLVQKESFVFETPVATRVGPRIQTFKSRATAFFSLFGMFSRFHHPQSEFPR